MRRHDCSSHPSIRLHRRPLRYSTVWSNPASEASGVVSSSKRYQGKHQRSDDRTPTDAIYSSPRAIMCPSPAHRRSSLVRPLPTSIFFGSYQYSGLVNPLSGMPLSQLSSPPLLDRRLLVSSLSSLSVWRLCGAHRLQGRRVYPNLHIRLGQVNWLACSQRSVKGQCGYGGQPQTGYAKMTKHMRKKCSFTVRVEGV